MSDLEAARTGLHGSSAAISGILTHLVCPHQQN